MSRPVPIVVPKNENQTQLRQKLNSRATTFKEREPLTNITNDTRPPVPGVGPNNKITKTSKPTTSNATTKRPLSVPNGGGLGIVIGDGTQTTTLTMENLLLLPNTTEEIRNKRRRSDPMELTEFEEEIILGWEDIDVLDTDDPQSITMYVNEIYAFLMEKEKNGASPNYMSNQTDINEKMRCILVDWLVEVHRMFKLMPETLFLSVNIIDRYLEGTPISREKLQLVGVTAMFIASKYEEIYAPECNDFVYIADGAYSKMEILNMEQQILNSLEFNLSNPSTLHFLRRYSKAAGSDYEIHTLCKYIIELVLMEMKLLKYNPSHIAASAVYVARAMTHKTPLWTPTLEHFTTYLESQIRPCALELNEMLKRSQNVSCKAIRKKYESDKNGQVAFLSIVDTI